MPAEPDQPVLVEDDRALARFLDELSSATELAVDTEADSFYSYREKVCLVQVTAGERDYLIDPLAKLDLAPVGALLADPTKLKVFHDGEYDVLLLKRERGFRFANLFDTRVAAAALGVENPGLANVLEDHFGVRLDKSMQRSDWSRRPLSAQQIAYARLDTRYLLPLMREQRKALEERGRLAIVEGECRRLEALEASEARFQPDDWVRLKGARELSPARRRGLRELFALRDEIARERDASPFRVVQNAVLVAIAQRAPRTRQELGEVSGFSWRQVKGFGDRVLAVLEEARRMEPIQRLPLIPAKDGTAGMSPEELELFERLKTWRKRVSEREGMDASLVLNRHVLVRLVRARPASLEELERTDGLVAWQRERYAEELLALVRRFESDLAAGLIDFTRRRSPRH